MTPRTRPSRTLSTESLRHRSRSVLKLSVALALLAVPALVAGCATSEGDGKDPGWTVLQYSMADTNLEPYMVQDLNELGEVSNSDDLAVRAFFDRSPDYGDDEVLDVGSWVGARVLDVHQGSAEVVDDLGDVDSADPQTLATFIAEGIAAHPNGHYALILSDHGASWPGVGPDEGSGYDVLDLAQLEEGIASGLEQAGIDKLDLLGFDACLMGSYEVASALAPYADRLIASQELEPGHGWDYHAFEVLAQDPATTADQLGEAIIDGFSQQAKESGTQDSITLAMIDLTKMDAVDAAVDEFSQVLSDRIATVAPALGQAEAVTLGFARSPDETQDSHMKDLALLAGEIGAEALDVSDQADAVIRAVDDAVVDKVDGQATKGATGLSIYFPPSADLADGAYLDVSSADAWGELLGTYYDEGAQIPSQELPQFISPDGVADVEFDDGIYVSGTYDEVGQSNLTSATISYAFVENDGSLTYFGEETADIDPDGEPVANGYYDLTALTISDGEDTSYAYVSLERDDDSDVYLIDVPMAYYGPDDVNGETYQDVLLELVIDVDSGDIQSETYYAYDPQTDAYGELTADPDGLIVPEVLILGADGSQEWVPTNDVGLYADLVNLQYDLEPLPSGTQLQVDLTVYDYGDNSSTVSAVVEVP